MGKITALSAQVKNPDRVNVYVDGAFAVGLALSLAVGLRLGQEISQSELEQLDQRDEVHRARERVLGLWPGDRAARPRSGAIFAVKISTMRAFKL